MINHVDIINIINNITLQGDLCKIYKIKFLLKAL